MRNSTTSKLLFFASFSLLLSSCNQDDYALTDDGVPDSIINTDPEGSPSRGLTEDWNGHNDVLNRQVLSGTVGVYYDDAVDRTIAWPFDFFPNAWNYVIKTYGTFGDPNNLFVIGHDENISNYYKTYFDADSGERNIIDFSITSTSITPEAIDPAIALMGQLVENANNNKSGSPAEAIWRDKFQEIFIYDIYTGIDLDADGERVKAKFLNNTVDYPRPGTQWFKNWFLPIYETYGGTISLKKFFNLLAASYPAKGVKYDGEMTLGEMVHFFSGSTGEDLEPLAIAAFGFDDSNKLELLKARAEFPNLNYPFEPASKLIDVTSEGMATIEVSSENVRGANGNEGSLKIIDGNFDTKFLTDGFPKDFYMQQIFNNAQIVNKYSITSANDAVNRDLKNWVLLGSNDGVNFDELDSRTEIVFSERNKTIEFTFDNKKAFKIYRIRLDNNNGSNLIQLSEWRLLNLKLLTFGPQDVTDLATLTVNQENADGAAAGEGSPKLIDGDGASKYLVRYNGFPINITQNFTEAQRVTKYTLTSANDGVTRDPTAWKLQGSNDNITYVDLDSQENQSFDERGKTFDYLVNNQDLYLHYRLSVSANGGDALFQLAEWRLLAE